MPSRKRSASLRGGQGQRHIGVSPRHSVRRKWEGFNKNTFCAGRRATGVLACHTASTCGDYLAALARQLDVARLLALYVKWQICRAVKLSNCEFTVLSSCQFAASPTCQVANLPCCQVAGVGCGEGQLPPQQWPEWAGGHRYHQATAKTPSARSH